MRYRKQGGWLSRAWDLGQLLRPAAARSDRLLVLGSESFEPWHVTAHLDDQARLLGAPTLRPTLLRRSPPPDAPAHLRHSMDDLRDTGRRHTVLIVAPDELDADALSRLSDARRRGALLLGVTADAGELAALTDNLVSVTAAAATTIGLDEPDFAVATHLVAVSAGDEGARRRSFFTANR
jgi:hypothetical protein